VYAHCVEDLKRELVSPADVQTLLPQSSGAAPLHITVRQVAPQDAPLLIELLSKLSDQTRYRRYFRPAPLTREWAEAEARRLANGYTQNSFTLLATIRCAAGMEAIGLAELRADPHLPSRAEVALLVRDDQQRRGVGTALIHRLAAAAHQHRVVEVHADVLPENRAPLRLLQRLGLPYSARLDAGLVHLVWRADTLD
jgi:RimJ/RimL family protein N-acetyltransferase